MITGFNTDVEHDGVVYHVQTEDKGLESPIILSLVYSGGTILASKRSPYADLIASGFSDEVLAERLKRQHRLICAAIHSGRIEDLRKMSGRAGTAELKPPVALPVEPETPPEPVQTVEESFDDQIVRGIDAEQAIIRDLTAQREMERSLTPDPEIIQDAPPDPDIIRDLTSEEEIVRDFTPEQSPQFEAQQPPPEEPDEITLSGWQSPEELSALAPVKGYSVFEPHQTTDPEAAVENQEGLLLTLLDEEEFVSGDSRMLRVLVRERRGAKEKALSNVPVSIKILGTAFRPLIFSLKTERDGVASVSTEIPHFTSGRAAVLIRVVAKDTAAELRRVIHPAI